MMLYEWFSVILEVRFGQRSRKVHLTPSLSGTGSDRKKRLKFDFEGFLIEPVERFLRGFGVTQIPYFSMSKVISPILKMHQRQLPMVKGVVKRV